MFKKKIILILIFCFSFVSTYATETNSKTTGTGGRDDFSHLKAKNSNFKKGNNAFKQAKKYDHKGKVDKAKKRFNDAINFFVLANEESPNNLLIISRLGYSFKEIGDFSFANKLSNSYSGISSEIPWFLIDTIGVSVAQASISTHADAS